MNTDAKPDSVPATNASAAKRDTTPSSPGLGLCTRSRHARYAGKLALEYSAPPTTGGVAPRHSDPLCVKRRRIMAASILFEGLACITVFICAREERQFARARGVRSPHRATRATHEVLRRCQSLPSPSGQTAREMRARTNGCPLRHRRVSRLDGHAPRSGLGPRTRAPRNRRPRPTRPSRAPRTRTPCLPRAFGEPTACKARTRASHGSLARERRAASLTISRRGAAALTPLRWRFERLSMDRFSAPPRASAAPPPTRAPPHAQLARLSVPRRRVPLGAPLHHVVDSEVRTTSRTTTKGEDDVGRRPTRGRARGWGESATSRPAIEFDPSTLASPSPADPKRSP